MQKTEDARHVRTPEAIVQLAQQTPISASPRPGRRVRLHNNHVGMVLDSKRQEIARRVVCHGHASATAVKLLAIKSWMAYETNNPNFVLNKDHVRIHFGIGWRRFNEGIRLLKRAGVLTREQKNHRAYATEVLAPGSEHYVELDADLLLNCKPVLFAFMVVVNLSPKPSLPAQAAKRFGITSPTTIRQLRDEAIKLGAVAYDKATDRVARKGHPFEPLPKAPTANKVKNGVAKNGAARTGITKNGDTQEKLDKVSKKKPSDLQPILEDFQRELPPPTGVFEEDAGIPTPRERSVREEEDPFDSVRLLGWIGGDRLAEACLQDDVNDEHLELMTERFPDTLLRELVLQATGGRVHREIVGPVGLVAVRWLAGAILARSDEGTPQEAMNAVLGAMWDRIGSRRGDSLNSLKLIGQRMAGHLHYGYSADFYGRPR